MSETSFNMEEWLESVAGETVTVTSTPDGELGPHASKLLNSPTVYSIPHCNECEEHVRLVKVGGGAIGRCPLCGRNPGALELGTTRKV